MWDKLLYGSVNLGAMDYISSPLFARLFIGLYVLNIHITLLTMPMMLDNAADAPKEKKKKLDQSDPRT